MKEIKLVKTALEEAPELALVDPRNKKKDKNKRLTNDRDRRKIEKEKAKELRKRSRLISKRKPKDEFPELQEVEDKFFEIVKRVISK